MSIGFAIDADRHLVHIRASGTVRNADIVAVTEAIAKHPLFKPEFDAIIDAREVTEDYVTPTFLADIRDSVFAPSSRRAFLVTRAVEFGMARLYGAHVDDHRNVQVFVNPKDAGVWLNLTPDAMWPVRITDVETREVEGS